MKRGATSVPSNPSLAYLLSVLSLSLISSHLPPSSMSLRSLVSLRSVQLPATLAPRCAQASRVRVAFYSTSTPRDREAELSAVLDTARRNVANGKRAPVGKDDCVRMAAFGKPGAGKVS